MVLGSFKKHLPWPAPLCGRGHGVGSLPLLPVQCCAAASAVPADARSQDSRVQFQQCPRALQHPTAFPRLTLSETPGTGQSCASVPPPRAHSRRHSGCSATPRGPWPQPHPPRACRRPCGPRQPQRQPPLRRKAQSASRSQAVQNPPYNKPRACPRKLPRPSPASPRYPPAGQVPGTQPAFNGCMSSSSMRPCGRAYKRPKMRPPKTPMANLCSYTWHACSEADGPPAFSARPASNA
jgi:hypothetical protein